MEAVSQFLYPQAGDGLIRSRTTFSCSLLSSSATAVTLKGAFIQIMPLTWDALLLPVVDRHPWLTI